MKFNRLVVFGGSGGLGKPLSDELSKDYKVVALSSKDVDVTDFNQVKSFFENNNQDIVLNLSGYNYNTILHKYDGDDVEIKKQIQVNIEGNLNILANTLHQ